MSTPPQRPRIAPLGPHDTSALLEVDRAAWPTTRAAAAEDEAAQVSRLEWDRTRGAYLPGPNGAEQLVGVNSVYSLDLPVPGGSVACGGLTWVGVHPLHRRRGVLTAMIADQLRDVHERGEPVSALHASEATIYGRFGYGVATASLHGTVPRGAALREVPGSDQVTFRLERVDTDRHADVVGDCYEAARQERPGMVSRNSPAMRRRFLHDPPAEHEGGEPLLILTAEADGAGPVRGYALFRRIDGAVDGHPHAGTVKIRELVARDPAAGRALWDRLLNLDLIRVVHTGARAADDPLLHLLLDRRAARLSAQDALWVRLVDLPAALAARRYAGEVDVVFDLRDRQCPWNAGRWRLSAGPDGAECTPSSRPAAFGLDVRDLGSAYLGSVSLAALAGAGLVDVTDRDALAAAARAFSWPVAAYCGWVF